MYPFYDRDQDQYTQHISVVHSKTRFKGVADIIHGEFQGHYVPFNTDHQGNFANSQLVKGKAIVQNITPIHVIPTPQAQELTACNDGTCQPTQFLTGKYP